MLSPLCCLINFCVWLCKRATKNGRHCLPSHVTAHAYTAICSQNRCCHCVFFTFTFHCLVTVSLFSHLTLLILLSFFANFYLFYVVTPLCSLLIFHFNTVLFVTVFLLSDSLWAFIAFGFFIEVFAALNVNACVCVVCVFVFQ